MLRLRVRFYRVPPYHGWRWRPGLAPRKAGEADLFWGYWRLLLEWGSLRDAD